MKHECAFGSGSWCLFCGAPKPLTVVEEAELEGLLEDDFVGSEARFWGLHKRRVGNKRANGV